MSPERPVAEERDEATAARVLVVDDNEDNRDMLTRRLQRKGYSAIAADGGPAALERVAEGGIDIVLLDVMMPGMSGLEVLAELRKERSKADLPIIMATAKAESRDVVEALRSGANDYVTKPIDFPVLLARLESHLSIQKLAEEKAEKAAATMTLSIDRGLAAGVVIDERYEIIDVLGRGGFATVYRAKQLSTGRTVALKCLLPDRVALASDDTDVTRFIREMEVIGELDHPHIVRLIDSGSLRVRFLGSAPPGGGWAESAEDAQRASHEPTVDAAEAGPASGTRPTSAGDRASLGGGAGEREIEVPYLVMEHLEGSTLAQRLSKHERLPVADAVDLMLPILSALSAAHQAGVVHRDIKPANVFLVTDDSGRPTAKVLDFGIAMLSERSDEALTVDQAVIGTPEYMSPEQATGERDLDGRADQFSVAAILYHCITGRRLYKAKSLIALVRKVTNGDFPRPSVVVPELPAGLERAMLRALASEREERFSSVETFGNALLPFASETAQRRWEDRFSKPTDRPPPPDRDKDTVAPPAMAKTRSDAPGKEAARGEEEKDDTRPVRVRAQAVADEARGAGGPAPQLGPSHPPSTEGGGPLGLAAVVILAVAVLLLVAALLMR